MIVLQVIGAILVISLLVIIHEGGHYLVARAFGMRVTTFSIGFGPVIARWRPKGSETVFQIAALPVLAYVQIAGMSPTEEVDPNDRGSYLNAPPIARFLTIAAGPIANYLAAGFALFLLVGVGGVEHTRARVGGVAANTPAAAVGFKANDLILSIDQKPVDAWEDLLVAVQHSQGKELTVLVQRDAEQVTLHVTPRLDPSDQRFRIGISPPDAPSEYRPASWKRAVEAAVVGPAIGTVLITKQVAKMFRRDTPVEVGSVVKIVSETVKQAKHGWRNEVDWVAGISLQLFIFNLLPIPVLDGGRLLVLAYEMVMRRRPNPKVEARVMTVSMALMLGLFLFVTSKDIWGLVSGLFSKGH